MLLVPSRIPTLMVLGSVDKNIPKDVTSGVQRWATKTIVIHGYGHSLQDNIPKEPAACFSADLERFVRAAVASSATRKRMSLPCTAHSDLMKRQGLVHHGQLELSQSWWGSDGKKLQRKENENHVVAEAKRK